MGVITKYTMTDIPTATTTGTMTATPEPYTAHITIPDAPTVLGSVVFFVIVAVITMWKWVKRIVV